MKRSVFQNAERFTLGAISVSSYRASNVRGKSEEVKLEVTRAPTIRLRLCMFWCSCNSSFVVTKPNAYIHVAQAHYASHCNVSVF